MQKHVYSSLKGEEVLKGNEGDEFYLSFEVVVIHEKRNILFSKNYFVVCPC